jgi:hypothetical protein
VYHFLNTLNNSVKNAEEGQLMRRNFKKFAQLINLSNQQKGYEAYIYDIESGLNTLLPQEKTKESPKSSTTRNILQNGLCEFMKRFTKQSGTLEERLDNKEIKNYLDTLERNQAADKELKENRPT